MTTYYRKNFKKIAHGFFQVRADSIKEAQAKFDNGDYDEFDNKSDYELCSCEWIRKDSEK